MEKPVVPYEDYSEYEDVDLNELEEENLKQQRHKAHGAVGDGEDERGPFDIIPVSMLLGGDTSPTPIHKLPMKHIVVNQSIAPRGWYKNKKEATDRIRPRPCYTEALLTTPYGGFCPVGCSFCYINNGSRGYRATGFPTVDPDYPDKFAKQLAKLMVSGAGYMTSFSEAFHILEDTYHVTQKLTDAFVNEGLPIFYCTRRLPAEWAIDALQENPYSYIQWSVNTSSPRDFKLLSPGAAKLDDIFAYVERLSGLGIYTSFQCNPINAGITSLDDLVELVHISGDIGLDHIIFKFTEQVANARQIIIDRLKQRRFEPERVKLFDEWFNQVIGGVYTIQESIRIEWLDVLLEETRKAGITMSTCYEYFDDGKAGDNLAPFYTTSDQCHGRGIPVYFRPEPGEPFEPLPGCYRKGCLYCADYGTKACNNETLQQARALEYKDLRTIHIEGDEANWNLPDSCVRPEDAGKSLACNPNLDTDAEMWEWELDE
jgi:DNA repair photolyase